MSEQTRLHSALEAVANIAAGSAIAYAAQVVIFPLYGVHFSTGEHLQIMVLFTVVSLARSYALRRVFNRWHARRVV